MQFYLNAEGLAPIRESAAVAQTRAPYPLGYDKSPVAPALTQVLVPRKFAICHQTVGPSPESKVSGDDSESNLEHLRNKS